jgi:hypothetical protein
MRFFEVTIAVIVAGYFSFQLYKLWSLHITVALRKYPFFEVAAGAAIWPFCISCISISAAVFLVSDKTQKRLEFLAKGLAASLLLSIWIGISLSTFMWVFGWSANKANNIGGGIVGLMLALISAGCVFVAPIWFFDKVRK